MFFVDLQQRVERIRENALTEIFLGPIAEGTTEAQYSQEWCAGDIAALFFVDLQQRVERIRENALTEIFLGPIAEGTTEAQYSQEWCAGDIIPISSGSGAAW